jgi:hypothetical protein
MVKKHRILRLTFHEKLNWKEQYTRRKGEGDKEAQSTKKLVSHIMGTLSTLRYGKEAYGPASCAVLRQLDAVHYKGVRLGTFVICRKPPL